MKQYSDYKDLKLKILNIVRNKGPITKQKIATELGVNLTTITDLVNKLLGKYKIIEE